MALTKAVEMPAVIEGRTAGTLTVEPGTIVKVVKVEGPNLRLRHRDSVILAPRSSTDYDRRVKVVVVLDPAPTPVGQTPAPTPTPEPSATPKVMWTPQPSGLDTRTLK